MRSTLPKSNCGFIHIPLQVIVSLFLVLSLAATTAYVANPELKQTIDSFAKAKPKTLKDIGSPTARHKGKVAEKQAVETQILVERYNNAIQSGDPESLKAIQTEISVVNPGLDKSIKEQQQKATQTTTTPAPTHQPAQVNLPPDVSQLIQEQERKAAEAKLKAPNIFQGQYSYTESKSGGIKVSGPASPLPIAPILDVTQNLGVPDFSNLNPFEGQISYDQTAKTVTQMPGIIQDLGTPDFSNLNPFEGQISSQQIQDQIMQKIMIQQPEPISIEQHLKNELDNCNRYGSVAEKTGATCVINSEGKAVAVNVSDSTVKTENIGFNSTVGQNDYAAFGTAPTEVACGGLGSVSCQSNTLGACNSGLTPDSRGICLRDFDYTEAEALATMIQTKAESNGGIITPEEVNILVALNPEINSRLSEFSDRLCPDGNGTCVYSDIHQKFESVGDDKLAAAYWSFLADDPKEEYQDFTGNLNQPCTKKYVTSFKGTLCDNPMLACGQSGKCKITGEAKNMLASRAASQSVNNFEINVSVFAPSELNKNKELARSGCTQSKSVYVQNGSAWVCWDADAKIISPAPDISYAEDEKLAQSLFAGIEDSTEATVTFKTPSIFGKYIYFDGCPGTKIEVNGVCVDPKIAAFDDTYGQGLIAGNMKDSEVINAIPGVDWATDHIIAPIFAAVPGSSYYKTSKSQAEMALIMMENKPEGVTNDQIMATISPNARAYVHILIADKLINDNPEVRDRYATTATLPHPLTQEEQDVADLTLYKNMAYLSLFTSAWTENTAESITGEQAFLNYAQTFADPNSTEAQKWGASAAFGGETALVVADVFTMGALGKGVEKVSVKLAERAPAWAAVRAFDNKIMTNIIAVPFILTGKVKTPIYMIAKNVYENLPDWLSRRAASTATDVAEKAVERGAEKAVVETAEQAVEQVATEVLPPPKKESITEIIQSLPNQEEKLELLQQRGRSGVDMLAPDSHWNVDVGYHDITTIKTSQISGIGSIIDRADSISVEKARELFRNNQFDWTKTNYNDPIVAYELPDGSYYIESGRHRATAAVLENVDEIQVRIFPLIK